MSTDLIEILFISHFFSWPSSEAGSYTELFRNLAAVIRDQRVALAVKWEEATDVIEIIELAHKSSREGVTIEVP